MKLGVPLTDEDRTSWLDALRQLVLTLAQRAEAAIVTSSALKRAYREHILGDTENALRNLVHLAKSLSRGRQIVGQGWNRAKYINVFRL